jgi:hypothetical protein
MTRNKNLFAVTLWMTALVVGCGNGPQSGTPTGVAEAFYEEMAAGNVEAAKALSTPETAEMLDYIAATHCTEMFHVIAEGGAAEASVEKGAARVRFVEGGGFATVPLVEVEGEWKVDFATMMKAHMQPEPMGVEL